VATRHDIFFQYEYDMPDVNFGGSDYSQVQGVRNYVLAVLEGTVCLKRSAVAVAILGVVLSFRLVLVVIVILIQILKDNVCLLI
jgi:hypothetical protein